MKITKKSVLCIALAAVLALSLAACQNSKQKEDVVVTNGDYSLTVPGDYADLVAAEAPEADADGILFTVSEKASVEAAEARGETDIGAGWLFDIGTITEDELHQRLCNDMSGQEVFAKDANGTCYMLYHPTDVRIEREGDITDDDMAQWSALNEWAASVPESFIANNEGLVSEKRGNSEMDIYLNRAAYMDDTIYTISTNEFGPKTGDSDAAKPFVDVLTKGASLEYLDISEVPDGEYVVLYFPVDDMRFDFFFAENKVNYVRRIWSGNEELYKITYEDGTTNATEVMNDWYHVLAGVDAAEGGADAAGAVSDAADTAAGAAKDAAGTVAEAAKDAASTTASAAKDAASTTASAAKDVASTTASAAKDAASTTASAAKDAASTTASAAKDAANTAAGAAKDAVESVTE
ncbi:MAG: hypothetical protein IIZ19_09615 [Clostridia bacterium]|nr:hypothetical protein [Clostridia bacterium]